MERRTHPWVATAALAAAAVIFLLGRDPLDDPLDATVALCVVARNEKAYIDEWVEHHLRLGFDKIYVYDNSDDNELAGLPASWPGRVEVTHFPSEHTGAFPLAMQLRAYNECLERCRGRHWWLACFDVDEFLVLRKHRDVKAFLAEHCPTGAVSINWLMFGTGGATTYAPRPVRERFLVRAAAADPFVKTIVRVQDAAEYRHDPHFPLLREGLLQHDTSGRQFVGSLNPGGPTDVAALYHYYTKSEEESLQRRKVVPSPPADLVEDRSALALV